MVAAIARCDPLAALACVEEGASADQEHPVSWETILVAAARTACVVPRHTHRARGRSSRQVEEAAQARRAQRRQQLATERAVELMRACVDTSLRAATEGRVWAPSPAAAELERMLQAEEARSGATRGARQPRSPPGSRPASKRSATTAATAAAPQSSVSTRAGSRRSGNDGEQELGVVTLLDRSGSSGQGSSSRPARPTLDLVARWVPRREARGGKCFPAHTSPLDASCGHTALTAAAGQGHSQVILALISRGARCVGAARKE